MLYHMQYTRCQQLPQHDIILAGWDELPWKSTNTKFKYRICYTVCYIYDGFCERPNIWAERNDLDEPKSAAVVAIELLELKFGYLDFVSWHWSKFCAKTLGGSSWKGRQKCIELEERCRPTYTLLGLVEAHEELRWCWRYRSLQSHWRTAVPEVFYLLPRIMKFEREGMQCLCNPCIRMLP